MQALSQSGAKGYDLRVFPDRSQMSRAVAEALADSARERTSLGKRFSLALAGGSTPRGLYEVLATEFRNEVRWDGVHFFFSDERWVPFDHPDSNYQMARETFLDAIGAPKANIHLPRTDLDDPEEAATRYEEDLRDYFGSEEPRLDWVLLGLGEDGHIASLFPRSTALAEAERWVVAVRESPKPPPIRLTMTLPLINLASQVHFMVSGDEKADALAATLEGPRLLDALPASLVEPFEKASTWWVDEAATRRLGKIKD
jgi:6-phosphogluconolactonase